MILLIIVWAVLVLVFLFGWSLLTAATRKGPRE